MGYDPLASLPPSTSMKRSSSWTRILSSQCGPLCPVRRNCRVVGFEQERPEKFFREMNHIAIHLGRNVPGVYLPRNHAVDIAFAVAFASFRSVKATLKNLVKSLRCE